MNFPSLKRDKFCDKFCGERQGESECVKLFVAEGLKKEVSVFVRKRLARIYIPHANTGSKDSALTPTRIEVHTLHYVCLHYLQDVRISQNDRTSSLKFTDNQSYGQLWTVAVSHTQLKSATSSHSWLYAIARDLTPIQSYSQRHGTTLRYSAIAGICLIPSTVKSKPC